MSAPVSAVIPCYRCEDTILRSAHSVWTQTKRPAELVLVDDASGDGTLLKLQGLRETYGKDWVKVISLPINGGPAHARNAGWEAAAQPFVAFLDGDNTWHPCKIDIQCGWMEEHPEAVFTGHRCVWVRGQAVSQDLPEDWSAPAISYGRQLLWNRFQTSSVMIRRDCPLRFRPYRRYSEDYLLWNQLLASGHAGHVLELTLGYHYKPLYGHSGPSGDLWAMEKGELETYRILSELGHLSRPARGLLSAWSLARHLRRKIICSLRSVR
ncbi:MAG: glycosyltransferase family 2 protein [Elusimicrobia bacterium]|nr:glycosyltransferase family 2 protein [Elusimicrobiota bacterium]